MAYLPNYRPAAPAAPTVPTMSTAAVPAAPAANPLTKSDLSDANYLGSFDETTYFRRSSDSVPGTNWTRIDRLRDRVGTGLILLLAALVRFIGLSRPGTLVFDETYYVKDAFTLWRLGFEARWPAEIDAAFAAGDIYSYLNEAAFVVHPPVGKWMIAWGLAVGGAQNAWAWRFTNAVVGVLAVWMMTRVARMLFRSTNLGLISGLLMAVDGMAIVHSRVALLDQFLMFFVLAAFWALLLDRQQFRGRLDQRITHFRNAALETTYPHLIQYATTSVTSNSPELTQYPANSVASTSTEVSPISAGAGWQFLPRTFRWWRLVAGVLLGLACGVKWSGAYFLAGFGLLTVLWDLTAYRAMARKNGIQYLQLLSHWLHDAATAFLSLVPVAALTYLATWASWFTTPGAFGRNWAAEHPGAGITWLPPILRSWVHYQNQVWTFHTGLSDPHPYASPAWAWIMQLRPTAFFWGTNEDFPNYAGCARLRDCTMAINALGNPFLWWLAALAILATIWFGILLRDWQALAVLSGLAFGWLPWLLYPERTTFAFYSIAFLPWLILTLCYAFWIVRHWRWGRRFTLITVSLIVLVSILYYPIWTALPIEHSFWRSLMLLPSWI